MAGRLICGDNLDVLKSDAIDTASVDLIYLDPPFNSHQHYNLPLKKLGKDSAAVEAFKDIWHWDDTTRDLEGRLKTDSATIALWHYINNVKMIRGGEDNVSAYLVNMAIRLNVLRRVMKSTGTLYLHCDPTASHYLKLILDNIFGPKNFRNEIIWCYKSGGASKRDFARKHDIIFRYTKSNDFIFNYEKEKSYGQTGGGQFGKVKYYKDERGTYSYAGIKDWWEISMLSTTHPERLGYPTQKPLALLERIIKASSNENDIVCDPFCGCGTTLHTSEKLHRNWIGIDISRYSIGVVKNRLAESFEPAILKQITLSGIPLDVESALDLARENPWEFEKWMCGQLGAKGLYKRPGAKGADAGIDGVVEFYADPKELSYAIIQVKGGHVGVNDVKALYTDVITEPRASAGVFVCFERYKRTALGAAPNKTFTDEIAGNKWPTIQILTVEDVLSGAMPKLPNQIIQQGFRTPRAQRQLL